ncbi:MAG: adenosyl-hopene transferase HpnH [Dehalococcoidia bacterium]|nr:adenosyl-hopene transferase HpnH [Dehalococcoidia bacterium]
MATVQTIQVKKAQPKLKTAEEGLKEFMPEGMRRAPKRPVEIGIRLFAYLARQKLRGRKRFPLVTMLEPLEACNLTCEGCGRIREYEPVIHRMLTVEEALAAVEASGAPIVSIAGGEPTMYPHLPELINELVRRKYFVYCCTNGILLGKMMEQIPPSKYLSWVIHLDGMEEKHDVSVARRGVFRIAMRAAKKALERGYRVCSNTTLFRGADKKDLHQLFDLVTKMGFEGIMISAGYDFAMAPDQEMFLKRKESNALFQDLLDDESIRQFRFYNNPLYLDFLKGRRHYQCTAYSNPTYTIQGWRVPCYPLADRHTQDVNEIFKPELWDHYGPGKNPKCANCMMHCGFESATIFGALSNPKDMVVMAKGIIAGKSGVGAS